MGDTDVDPGYERRVGAVGPGSGGRGNEIDHEYVTSVSDANLACCPGQKS